MGLAAHSRTVSTESGPRARPPVAVLRWCRIRVDDTPEEYLAEARRHPLFELRPMPEAARYVSYLESADLKPLWWSTALATRRRSRTPASRGCQPSCFVRVHLDRK